MPMTAPHLGDLSNLARKPQPVTRKRIYGTLELVFGALVLWGVISADEMSSLLDLWDKLVPLFAFFMARKNVG